MSTQPHESRASIEAEIDRVLADCKRGIFPENPPFVPTPASNIGERIDDEIENWNQQRSGPAPFPEFGAAGDDTYDLCVWLTFNLVRYPGGVVADRVNETTRELCIEAGRNRGAWHLRVSPWTGSLTDDDVLAGPPIVDLRDQTAGPDPLALLRALLSGGSA